MINREITYERNVNASYMKIPAVLEENFDERIMLKQVIKGTLQVEKIYENGKCEYWYMISGKQALDAYCRVNAIDLPFFENLMLRFCEQVEILEWGLVDINCLMVDPELIFVGNGGCDISFIIYPDNKNSIAGEIQQLFEFLLTKIKHGEPELVTLAYSVYERILSEEFTVTELKRDILKRRMQKTEAVPSIPMRQPEVPMATPDTCKLPEYVPESMEKVVIQMRSKLQELYHKAEEILKKRINERDSALTVVYPEDVQEEERLSEREHPTIYIGTGREEPRGILRCCDSGGYPDISLEKNGGIIGKSAKAKYRIERDTVSQMHAKVEYFEKKYSIEDLNSTNGTYVNDTLLGYKQPYVLERGDVLRIADVNYRFD